ncbi:MAG: hypothetical protein QQN41_08715 [Nitrosopumilus sp.]
METSIKIKERTKKKLNLLKYKLGLKSIDETIMSMYNIITKFKIAGEMVDGK